MTHVSSKGVGFILVCVNPLPRTSHHTTPSSHLHRPHGSSLSMEIYGKPETIWVPPDFPARPPFRVLQVLFVSTGTGSRHATSPEWFLWLSFWLDRFSSTAIRTFEVFQTSAYARNVSGLYPRTSPRALRFAFFKSSSYTPKSPRLPEPASVLRNQHRSDPRGPPRASSPRPLFNQVQSCLQVTLCPLKENCVTSAGTCQGPSG